MAKHTNAVSSEVRSGYEVSEKPEPKTQLAAGGSASSRESNLQSASGFGGGGKRTEVRGAAASSPQAEDAVMLCNITDQMWLLHRTHGTFTIAACEPGAEYALTPVTGRMSWIDRGDDHRSENPITARQLADDLAREINSDAGEGSFFGVFVCAGSEPTDEELIEAHEKLEAFYRSLVVAADRQWERTHNVVLISDLERRAAKALRLERDWCSEAQQRTECPACGERLKAGVAVCRVCGAVLNPEKAAQFGLGGAQSGEHTRVAPSGGSSSSTAN
jgi:hypothetical protein